MNKFQQIDKIGQAKVIEQLPKLFSGQTLNIEQHYIDKSTIDILVTATTKNNVEHYYAIEAKDRWYKHTDFNEWYLEFDKKDELMKKQNYTPIYFNTFVDNYMIIWDLSKLNWSEIKTDKRYLKKCTVENRGKVLKDIYLLPTEKSIIQREFI